MSGSSIIKYMNHMLIDQQVIEIFHLIFLKALERKIEKSFYVLKGGCNLRFFFKSIRYSEDIDFDVTIISKETLKKNINQLLKAAPFQQILYANKIEIAHISDLKQTETTQRWKIGIRKLNFPRILSTKLEFSRRKMDTGLAFEPVDNQLIQTYKLQPVLCNHYVRQTAFIQKINALIHRGETQARDIFDIYFLTNENNEWKGIQKNIINELNISVAIENALSIKFSEFKSHVVSYLLPEYQAYYDSKDIWNTIQENVVNILEEL